MRGGWLVEREVAVVWRHPQPPELFGTNGRAQPICMIAQSVGPCNYLAEEGCNGLRE